MDTSIFTDKTVIPQTGDLPGALKETYPVWNAIRDHVHELFPDVLDEWHYSGAKYGWSFRIKDKKRVIVYLLPREGYFKAAFVFGQKATDIILESTLAPVIMELLKSAKVYAEGRGIRIDIRDESLLRDVKQLIEIKLSH